MSDYIFNLRKIVGTRPLMVPCASVIVVDEQNRILLQQRADNLMWDQCGGAMEPGEDAETTARRETFEEMGLTCGTLNFFGVYSGEEQHFKYPNGDEVYVVDIVYTCYDYKGTLRLDKNEVLEAAFFDIEHLPKNITPAFKPILNDFINTMRRT